MALPDHPTMSSLCRASPSREWGAGGSRCMTRSPRWPRARRRPTACFVATRRISCHRARGAESPHRLLTEGIALVPLGGAGRVEDKLAPADVRWTISNRSSTIQRPC